MKKIALIFFGLSLLWASGAWAAPYDFRLVIYASTATTAGLDQPYFELYNTSDGGAQITQFSITSGDPAVGYDKVWVTTSTADSFDFPDPKLSASDGNANVREIVANLTGFDSGENLKFRAEFDDYTNQTYGRYDFRTTLFNNGDTTPNAFVSVLFSDGTTLAGYLPDKGEHLYYMFNASELQATPIPAAVWLLGSGLAGLVGIRRRMKA